MATYIGNKFGQEDHARLVSLLVPRGADIREDQELAIHRYEGCSQFGLMRTCGAQADYQKRADPNNKQQQALLQEMQAHIKKVIDVFYVTAQLWKLTLEHQEAAQQGQCWPVLLPPRLHM